ncbi:flagellar basal-body rod protein FlgC [Roseivivax lentus]|uniref:Flagellar basal-body rod protein FlgC n=1 Tax=Roseivivax lentus TaxID=633194 RepID=A0A1N7JLA4_9RHOB|nr:flagellar basal body rod protein FlgC [Roseivivax lentus]SIS50036.1 flagellar basal-body rod protein FlgC [Roseivivax lentus]
MSDFSDATKVTASALQAQAGRLRLLSENIANADTPGYRRKTAPFESAAAGGQDLPSVTLGRTKLDRSDLARVHDPGHPLAGPDGFYESSNVDLLIEIADAREAQRSYEANLKMFEQTREMRRGLFDLLRR